MTRDGERVPMDFFSWHYYTHRVEKLMDRCVYFKDLVTRFGYGDIEIILNEWNYVKDWGVGFVDTILDIKGMTGAAFAAAIMSAVQKSGLVDMLMYYDARACAFCGLFDTDTLRPLKTYTVFSWFDRLYTLGREVAHTSDDEIYVTAACRDGKWGAMVTYYSSEEDPKEIELSIDVCGTKQMLCARLDQTNDGKVSRRLPNNTVLRVQPNTVLFLSGDEN